MAQATSGMQNIIISKSKGDYSHTVLSHFKIYSRTFHITRVKPYVWIQRRQKTADTWKKNTWL